MPGWIKIYRKIEDWEWYTDSHTVHLFLHLVMHANFEDKKWRGIIIKRGQIITGRQALSEATGISERSIRTCLDHLESTNEIARQPTNKYTIITITKYDDYQSNEDEIMDRPTSKTTNKTPTNDQQTTTTKELKNMKKKKENSNNTDSEIFPEEKQPEEPKETWRDNYQIYLKECTEGFQKIVGDKKTIAEQEKFNPGVDVALSIEKGFRNFWGSEAGWKHKKKSRIKDINWQLTFINSISMNKVFYPRPKFEMASKPKTLDI